MKEYICILGKTPTVMSMADWQMMNDCDVVVMPDKWQNDKRCVNERYAALSLEKEVVYESRINRPSPNLSH